MTRRILSLFVIVAALLVVSVPAVKAQVTVNSDGVSVRNSAPADVFFMFPDTTNVHEVQLGCSNGGSNANWVFIYEEQPNGFVTTYPFHVTVTCNATPNPDGTTTYTLVDAITVNTPDHTVTIDSSTNWTVVRKTGRSGYYWAATGGLSTIVVQ